MPEDIEPTDALACARLLTAKKGADPER